MSSPDTDIDDTGLVAAARGGDDKAFAELVARHKGVVIRLVARTLDSNADVDDIAQEAFIRAYKGLNGFNGKAAFRSWVCRIAVNLCLDRHRQLKRRPFVTVENVEENPADEEHSGTPESRERVRLLHEAIRRLSPADRLVVTLLEIEERSVREVADLTGLSMVNVKVRAFRARRKLRSFLEEHYG